MKKLLALVLALVMTLGLATVGTNAALSDFKDADDINYEEAVAVMNAIGVMMGDEAGFRPADTLKRSEGAKIVAYFLLGNKAADAMQGSGAKFTDVPANHWAAGYIEYLASAGVLGGVGGGKFDPDGQLTAVQYAKMLLVALGYDASIEGFGGTDWSINVQKMANQVDLFNGNNSVTANGAVTREEAALYAFNALRSPLVEYDDTTSVTATSGDTVVTINSSNHWKYKMWNTSTAARDTISDDTAFNGQTNVSLIEFAEEYYKDLSNVYAAWDDQTGYNDLGQPVRKWMLNNAEVGTFVRKDALVTSWTKKVTAKDVYALLGSAYYDAQKDGLSALRSTVDGIAKAYWDAGKSGGNYDLYINKNNSTKINESGNGTVTELYTNKDKDLCFVTYNTYVFQAVGDYDSRNENIALDFAGDTENFNNTTLTNNFKLSLSDFPQIADWKKDDYVLITGVIDGNKLDPWTADKAELLTGKVDGYSYDEDYNVTIDGTKYSYGEKVLAGGNGVKNTMYTVGENTTVVLDKAGYIVAVDEVVVNDNFVFVTDFGSSNNTLNGNAMAHVVFTDGTEQDVVLNSAYDYGTPANGQVKTKATLAGWGEGHEMRWYTYSVDSAGKYTLYNANTGANYQNAWSGYAAGATVTESARVDFLGKGVYANNKTVMVLEKSDDSIDVYTGVASMPGIVLSSGTANVVARVGSGNYVSLVYIKLTGNASITGSSNDKLIYVLGYAATSRTTDNEVYYTYNTLDETGTKVARNADNEITGNQNTTWFDVANYATENSKGLLTNFVSADQVNDVVRGDNVQSMNYKDGALSLGGNTFRVTDDSKIMLVVRARYTYADGNTHQNRIMLTDKALSGAKDYEASILSASMLYNQFRTINNDGTGSYAYNYTIRLDNNAQINNTIKELFVTVTWADEDLAYPGAATPVTPTPGTTTTTVTVAAGETYASLATYAAAKGVTLADTLTTVTVNGALTIANGETLTAANVTVAGTGAALTLANGSTTTVTGTLRVEDNATFTWGAGSTATIDTLSHPGTGVTVTIDANANGSYAHRVIE